MSFWKKLFSKEPIKTEPKQSARNRQLPSQQVAPEFGEVDVLAIDHQYNRILFTILMEPTGSEAEGWQTGVAMDASASMQGEFGRLLVTGRCGPLPGHGCQRGPRFSAAGGWAERRRASRSRR